MPLRRPVQTSCRIPPPGLLRRQRSTFVAVADCAASSDRLLHSALLLLPVFLMRPAAEGQRRPNCSDFTDDVAGIRHLITGNSEAIRQGVGSCGDWVIWVEFVRVCLQRLVGVSDSGL